MTESLREPHGAVPGVGRLSSSGPFSDRLAFRVLLGIVFYAGFRNLFQARIKPLWFDELLTELMARQPNVSALWKGLKTAVDGMPPPFYLIERLAGSLPINEHIAYRLLSIVAFSFTVICVYFFVEHRHGPVIALFCACLLFLTPLYNYYADEARPYSMFVACIAFAAVCYQRAPNRRWTIGLFASLLLAMGLHYYAVLALSVFCGAELFFTFETRRLRPYVWSALLLPLVMLAFFRPLLIAIRASYAHFWSRPLFLDALKSYGEFFRIDTPWGFALMGVLALAVCAVFWQSRRRASETDLGLCPRNEQVLVLALLGYPLIIFVATKLLHGGFTPRYVLCGILGIAIAFGYLLNQLEPRATLVCLGFLAITFVTQEFTFWRTAGSNSDARGATARTLLAFANSVHREDLPLVIADPGQYFEILHYASPELKRRIVTVVDPRSAYLYLGTDTLDNIMLALRQLAPVKVYEFSEFTATNPSFLIYENGSGFYWAPTELLREGAVQRTIAIQDNGDRMYLVEPRPEPAARSAADAGR